MGLCDFKSIHFVIRKREVWDWFPVCISVRIIAQTGTWGLKRKLIFRLNVIAALNHAEKYLLVMVSE